MSEDTHIAARSSLVPLLLPCHTYLSMLAAVLILRNSNLGQLVQALVASGAASWDPQLLWRSQRVGAYCSKHKGQTPQTIHDLCSTSGDLGGGRSNLNLTEVWSCRMIEQDLHRSAALAFEI